MQKVGLLVLGSLAVAEGWALSSLGSSSLGALGLKGAQSQLVAPRSAVSGLRASLNGEETSCSRRKLLELGVFTAAGLVGAQGANAQDEAQLGTAEFGKDTLDRPAFRKRQDLVVEKPVELASDLNDVTLPVNGRQKKFGKVKGKAATILMNIKLDDPESLTQIPAMRSVVNSLSEKGLNVILFPTDQGDYEPDDSATVRIKLAQQFGMKSSSSGPVVVTDKTDIVGKFAHPLVKYATTSLPNPNEVTRITLNYEKFLMDSEGNVLRRYPRLWSAERMQRDIQAVLDGQPLPDEDPKLAFAWKEANKEVTRSMYSFRKHYNYYDQQEAGKDWQGTKSELFTPGSNQARFKGVTKGKAMDLELDY